MIEQPHREMHIARHADGFKPGLAARAEYLNTAESANAIGEPPLDAVWIRQVRGVFMQNRHLFLGERQLFVGDDIGISHGGSLADCRQLFRFGAAVRCRL